MKFYMSVCLVVKKATYTAMTAKQFDVKHAMNSGINTPNGEIIA